MIHIYFQHQINQKTRMFHLLDHIIFCGLNFCLTKHVHVKTKLISY